MEKSKIEMNKSNTYRSIKNSIDLIQKDILVFKRSINFVFWFMINVRIYAFQIITEMCTF